MNPLGPSTRIMLARLNVCRPGDMWRTLQHALLLVLAATSSIATTANRACAQQPLPHSYDWTIFECRSEFSLPDAESVGQELQSVREGLEQATGLAFPSEPVQLTLFATREQYIADVSQIADNAWRQRGVFVVRDETPHVYSFDHPGLTATLRHESTHALLHSALPYVPLWLDEGLASYFESELGPRQAFLGRVQLSLRLGWSPNLKTLESRKNAAEMDLGDYRHAWAWATFLLHESDESRSLLRQYLQNIVNGEPPQSFSSFIAIHMPDARNRCKLFLRGL